MNKVAIGGLVIIFSSMAGITIESIRHAKAMNKIADESLKGWLKCLAETVDAIQEKNKFKGRFEGIHDFIKESRGKGVDDKVILDAIIMAGDNQIKIN